MNRIFTKKVEYDFDGKAMVEIPKEICEELEIKDNDIIVFDHDDGKVIFRKRIDY